MEIEEMEVSLMDWILEDWDSSLDDWRVMTTDEVQQDNEEIHRVKEEDGSPSQEERDSVIGHFEKEMIGKKE